MFNIISFKEGARAVPLRMCFYIIRHILLNLGVWRDIPINGHITIGVFSSPFP